MNSISKGNEIIFRCYKSSQKILLVGEGDFSFSTCLAREFNKAQNIVATSYLNKDVLVQKHWSSVRHLEELERLGALLLYKVDVNTMNTHPVLKNMKFDVIIFNFPHAGHYAYLHERDSILIEMHRKLVGSFFKSASKMLNEGGEVHLRHRADPPYDRWNVVLLAGEAGLQLKDQEFFHKTDYPGYHNKRGGDDKTNKTFPIPFLCAFTYKFAIDLPKCDDDHLCSDDDVLNVNEVTVILEMKDVVNDGDNVHVLADMKDQHHDDQTHLKIDEVTAPFRNDEVEDDLVRKDNVVKDLYVHKYDEINNLSKKDDQVHDDASDVHVEIMNDYHEEQLKNGIVADDLRVIEMKEVVHDHDTPIDDNFLTDDGKFDCADLFKKDEVLHIDLNNSPQVGDDAHYSKIVEVSEVKTKEDQDLDVDHDLLTKKDEVHVLEMKIQDHDPHHSVRDDFPNNKLCDDRPNTNDGVDDDFDDVPHDLEMKNCTKNDEVDGHLDVEHMLDHQIKAKKYEVDDKLEVHKLDIEGLFDKLDIKSDIDETNDVHKDDNILHEHKEFCFMDAITKELRRRR